MRYLFLILKLKALERMRKRHEREYEAWIEATSKYKEGTHGFLHGIEQYRYHKQEIVKIDNLIKLLS